MTITEFDGLLPTIGQVQKLIREKTVVEWKLLTGDLLPGGACWQDHHCVCIVKEENQEITIWKQAMAYLQPK
ncbi:RNA-binding protein hfq [Chrysosporum ovalisporum ANA283AFssAo]|uniref:Hfq-related RNA-binding protein n=1 Tax=Umezakia ovalisporum TaxID=75695 RepID=UPI002474CF02|nr:RNA-binding protein hfq [Umezakia ovalisporum]MDH6103303.1 RNA-binding protein hfq [Umezakia ovalisporum ANA283AFssAo]